MQKEESEIICRNLTYKKHFLFRAKKGGERQSTPQELLLLKVAILATDAMGVLLHRRTLHL